MPEIKRWVGNEWVPPASIKRWDGSAWIDVEFARRWDGSGWQDAWLSPGLIEIVTVNNSQIALPGAQPGTPVSWRIDYQNDGRVRNVMARDGVIVLDSLTELPEWLVKSDGVTVGENPELFDVRFAPFGDGWGSPTDGPYNTWLNLGTTRSAGASWDGFGAAGMVVDIRRVSSNLIEASGTKAGTFSELIGTVSLANISIEGIYDIGEGQRSGFRVGNDGRCYQWAGLNADYTLLNIGPWANHWLTDASNFENFSVRATLQNGSFAGASAGVLNTWQNLSSSRTWQFGIEYDTTKYALLLIEIRRDSTGVVEASGVITLSYELS